LNQKIISGSTEKFYTSGPIFGGDCFINKFAVKRNHHFFSQFLHDVPDGYIYDYRIYRNVAYPRYWLNSTPYDLSGLVSQSPTRSKTPRNSYNLDCGQETGNALTVVKDKYFYLFNSGVIEFFVESDYNLDFRDWKKEYPNFYFRYNENLSTIFRSDRIEQPEEFYYDYTYSKQLLENTATQQSILFDPSIEKTCYTYLKNRVIYSLPAYKDQKADNWLTYLANNKYDFPLSEFGNLTAMHGVDNQQIMFLFDKASPYITIGRDELQLDGSGKKITLGDGGLFTREPRPIAYTDYYYGNSQSSLAFVNTQFGSFYPSQRQGRIFIWRGQSFDEISRNGMHFWFKNYLPSKLLEQFPNYKFPDNPIKGVGLLSVFDNTSEKYYLIKRDYSAISGKTISYDADKNRFYDGNSIISLGDKNYFEDASWTISYDPKTQSFISYHDWHPDLVLQTEKHFMTIKNNAIWKHNNRTDSFCNFYDVPYPFEIEYVINNGANVEILRNIEYYLEAGRYFSDGRDFHTSLDDNFDTVVISNAEQISGYLHPVIQPKKSMKSLLDYPLIDVANEWIKVLYNKEEQRIRINQFWDITKDRGEFDKKNIPLWLTATNGYIRTINSKGVDYSKRPQFRKKFRNQWHKILLSKTLSGNTKMIFKFSNAKENPSFR